ncbi:hypothetical protein [Thermocatellispora tengchongensis]|uniref:hypothetical protein n=1 Tax=Thermocatellispora tengchongensis TaxID=1073253 RepID=UPI0036435F2D
MLGTRPYEVLADGRLAVLHGREDLRLGLLDPETGALTDLDVPYDGWQPMLAADGTTLAGVAYGAAVPSSVVRLDLVTGRVEALRRDIEELPDVAYLPRPRPVEIETRLGRSVHAIVYPPANPEVTGDGARRRTSCSRTAVQPRTAPPRWTWRRRSSPAAASVSSTSTTAGPAATAAPTASGCAASGASWTSRT